MSVAKSKSCSSGGDPPTTGWAAGPHHSRCMSLAKSVLALYKPMPAPLMPKHQQQQQQQPAESRQQQQQATQSRETPSPPDRKNDRHRRMAVAKACALIRGCSLSHDTMLKGQHAVVVHWCTVTHRSRGGMPLWRRQRQGRPSPQGPP